MFSIQQYFIVQVIQSIFKAAICFIIVLPVFAETIITYREQESVSDNRYSYDTELLKLALEKTQQHLGSYKLIASPKMNFSRAIKMASDNSLPNLMLKLSYSDNHPRILANIPFPVDLGIAGYRVSFIADSLESKLLKVKSLDQLKQLSIGQGMGWTDVDILKENGFNVLEVPNYQGLFPMVAASRFDLLPRGINEFLGEWFANKHIDGFTYDKSFVLYYPLPRFFYTHSKNKEAISRIKLGLEIAYQDGSLMKLWKKNYQQSIDFINLKNRKIYKIKNTTIEGLEPSYEKYLFDPYK